MFGQLLIVSPVRLAPGAAMTRVAFVTGATGCVGLNLVELLLHEGWRVAALVRGGEHSSSAGAPFLRAIKARLAQHGP